MQDFIPVMAGLNISVEIKSADIHTAVDVSRDTLSTHEGKSESFDRVLAKAEDRSKPEAGTRKTQREKWEDSERGVHDNVKEPGSENSRSRNADEVNDARSSRIDGTSSDDTQKSGDEHGSDSGIETAQDTASIAREQLETIMSQIELGESLVPLPDLRLIYTGQPTAQTSVTPETVGVNPDVSLSGSVIGNIPEASIPATGPIPADAVLSEPAIPARHNQPILTPVPIVQQSDQSVITDRPVPELNVGSDSLEPSTSVIRSEWTNALDLGRLLNSRADRAESTQQQPIQHMKTVEVRVQSPETFQSRMTGSDLTDPPMGSRPAVTAKGLPGPIPETVSDSNVGGNRGGFSDTGSNMFNLTAATTAVNAVADTQVASRQFQGMMINHASAASPVTTTETMISDVRNVMMRIAADGSGEARLVLHPPELGELVVRLESAKNGAVRVEFHTASPLVRESLEAGITKLIDALKSEGLTLEKAEVQLHLNLGAEGNSSGQDNVEDGGAGTHKYGDNYSELTIEETMPVIERLPDGTTISVLA